MTTKNGAFGKRLSIIRKARGLSQRDLGRLVGMSNRMVAYYEAQTKRPPAAKLATFARVLNVSTDELLGIKPSSMRQPDNSRLWKRMQVFHALPLTAQKKIVEYAELLAQTTQKKSS